MFGSMGNGSGEAADMHTSGVIGHHLGAGMSGSRDIGLSAAAAGIGNVATGASGVVFHNNIDK